MWGRVSVTIGHASVCPSIDSNKGSQWPACLLLSALSQGILIGSCGCRTAALGNKCGYRHLESRWRRLNIELFSVIVYSTFLL